MSARGATVLVGFAESLAAVEVVWSLQEAGFQVTAFGRRGSRTALRRVDGVRVVNVTDPAHDVESTIGELESILVTDGWSAVMPLDDDAVWLLDRLTRSGRTQVPVAGPTGAHADLALDKRLQIEAARTAGFDVPQTLVVRAPGDPEALTDVARPCIVKPALAVERRGSGLGRGTVRQCRTLDEVLRATEQASDAQPLLVQPALTGTGEGVFGIALQGNVHALSGHRRLRMMNPAGSGASACSTRDIDREEADSTGRLVASTAWHGIFMVELLRDRTGKTWFMEINGRPWGSMALARRSGYEYPAWAVQTLLDSSVDVAEPPVPGHVVCRHAGREILHLLHVLRGPRSSDAGDWPGRMKGALAVLALHRGDKWYNHKPGAMAVVAADTWYTVRNQLRGIGR